jgi:microcystin-dependent protein
MAAIVGVHISGELPGAQKDYGSGTLPFGFLMCDGSAVSRTTYARLFSYIGTNFGVGDGSTTFNLPDCRGYFVRGWDNGAGNDPDSATRTRIDMVTVIGDVVGSYQDHEFEDHNHYFPVGGNLNGANVCASPLIPLENYVYTSGSGGSETRGLNVYFNKMIAYV